MGAGAGTGAGAEPTADLWNSYFPIVRMRCYEKAAGNLGGDVRKQIKSEIEKTQDAHVFLSIAASGNTYFFTAKCPHATQQKIWAGMCRI